MHQSYQPSDQQAAIWRSIQRAPVPNTQVVVCVAGPLEYAALHDTVRRVVDRHDILRTHYVPVPGMSAPLQSVSADTRFTLRRVDLRGSSAIASDSALPALLDDERAHPFDLSNGPLLSVVMCDLSDECHALSITAPAISMDRASLVLAARAVCEALAGKTASSEEDLLQYPQYAQWQADTIAADDDAARAGHDFWKGMVGNAARPALLPTPAASAGAADRVTRAIDVSMPESLWQGATALAQAAGISLPSLFEAAWVVVLARSTGEPDFLFGHGCDGRAYPELSGLVGRTARSLPIRCDVDLTAPFRSWARELSARIAEAVGWEEYFSSALLPDPAVVQFRFVDTGPAPCDLPASVAYRQICDDGEPYVCALMLDRDEGYERLRAWYDPRSLDGDYAARLPTRFVTLLADAVRRPDTPAGALALMPAEERIDVLTEPNRTRYAFEGPATLHGLFERAADRTPDAAAATCGGSTVTYSELDSRANKIASLLIRRGVGPDSVVGLCVDRSIAMVECLLGILKAAAAYLPLDPSLPADRLDWMLSDSGACCLVSNSTHAARLAYTGDKLLLDRDAAIIDASPASRPGEAAAASHLAYVIYTSGSTGRPKGVMVEHRNIVNYVHAIGQRLALGEGASYASVSTIAADLGNTCLFPGLCHGGRLHLINAETATDASRWRDYFAAHQIDCLKIVPSHLAALAGDRPIDPLMLPRRVLVLGGEASSRLLIQRITAARPGLRVLNHYGPTETTVGVLTFDATAGGCSTDGRTPYVPMGSPLANSRIYLLNELQQPVPRGVRGELYVGGDQVARGYHNNAALTEERFVSVGASALGVPDAADADPERLYRTGDFARQLADGAIEFLGRADHQIKVRGFRIELGEIESVLRSHPGIRDAVVVARDTGADKRLVGYIVGQSDGSDLSLRDYVASRLPDYMVPADIVALDRLPLTANGKVDRAALPAPEDVAGRERLAPRNAIEAQIHTIWTTVLGRNDFGVTESFFDVGGHSLVAMQVMSRLREVFEVDVPLRILFDERTVAGLAAAVESELESGLAAHEAELNSILSELHALSDVEAMALLNEGGDAA